LVLTANTTLGREKALENLTLASHVDAINWNRVVDPIDDEVWDRLTGNFWLPEKVPLSNDIQSWATLTDDEKTLTMRVFTGLTLFDTVQGTLGAISILPDAVTATERTVISNIAFVECVHANCNSASFSTLCVSNDSDAAFCSSRKNPYLQSKGDII